MAAVTKSVFLVIVSLVLFLCLFMGTQNRQQLWGMLYGFKLADWSYSPFHSSGSANGTQRSPRILMWTSFYGSWYGTLNKQKTGEDVTRGCAAKCFVTNDRHLLETSDAIVFHVRDMDMNDLPPRRSESQKWVFWSMEPPPYSVFAGFSYMHDMFNWTMSYRSDSDIYDPYGKVVPRNSTVSPKKDHRALWKSKKKEAVWMVSHCQTDSRREEYVKELKKHLEVDVYGGCGDHQCPRSRGDACYNDFEQTYFYMLAFENSLCNDYATEKFFSALKYDMVPVVFGGANYSRIGPAQAYVDALAFESPKKLAEHLRLLSRNYTAYSSYFKWKESHQVVSWDVNFCELCSQLQSPRFLAKSSYSDMRVWWEQLGRCRTWAL